jgi:hypothetical protein
MNDAARQTHRAELEIVVGSFFISFSGVFVKIAHVGPTAAGVYRNLFGALALLAITLARATVCGRIGAISAG